MADPLVRCSPGQIRPAGGRVSDPIPNSEQIEKEWRARLEAAAQTDSAARGQYRKALAAALSGEGLAEKSRLALDEAQRTERVARAEYLRILRIFKSFRIKGREVNHGVARSERQPGTLS